AHAAARNRADALGAGRGVAARLGDRRRRPRALQRRQDLGSALPALRARPAPDRRAARGRISAVRCELLDKTSAVHFLRFELDPLQIVALRGGASVRFGVNHPAYCYTLQLTPEVRAALLNDLA